MKDRFLVYGSFIGLWLGMLLITGLVFDNNVRPLFLTGWAVIWGGGSLLSIWYFVPRRDRRTQQASGASPMATTAAGEPSRSDRRAGVSPTPTTMDDQERAWNHIAADLRFGARACAVGLLLAYGLVFPLKWLGLMPDHLSWIGLTLLPAAMFGLLGSLLVGPLWLRERWWLVFVPAALLCWAIMLGLTWWG